VRSKEGLPKSIEGHDAEGFDADVGILRAALKRM
jgi:hypothetical protein